jgi:hypothetical protein
MLAGGCHCGSVRYEAAETPERHSICHCIDCRRSAGAPMVAWAVYKSGEVKVTKGEPKMRASSEHGRRYFCPDCGTGLFYTSEAYLPGLIDIQTATLDEPDSFMPPTAQVQVAERIGWMKDAHRSPEFARYPGME